MILPDLVDEFFRLEQLLVRELQLLLNGVDHDEPVEAADNTETTVQRRGDLLRPYGERPGDETDDGRKCSHVSWMHQLLLLWADDPRWHARGLLRSSVERSHPDKSPAGRERRPFKTLA